MKRLCAATTVTAMILAAIVGASILCACGGSPVPASEVLLTITPADGATGVPVRQVVTLTFNQDVDETTVIPANITLTHHNGIAVPGALAYNADIKTLTFTPTFPLSPGVLYTFFMSGSVMTKAAGDYATSFTTQTVPILFASNVNPADPTLTEPAVNLWSIEPDGTGATRLTALAAFGVYPPTTVARSHDSTRIAANFQDSATEWNVYVMNNDGSGFVKASDSATRSMLLNWFPDDSRILYLQPQTVDFGSPMDLVSVAPDGSDPVNLTNVAGGNTVYPAITFTPDGTQLIYTLYDAAAGTRELHAMNVDGTNDRALTSGGAGTSSFVSGISPDGTRVYYRFGPTAVTNAAIYAMNLDGTGAQALVTPTATQTAAIYGVSPDGNSIAYALYDNTTFVGDLWVMASDGSGQTKVTSADATNGILGSAWSPDGAKIAYVFGDAANGPADLYVASRDGSNAVKITDVGAGHRVSAAEGTQSFAWSPDGQRIVFEEDATATPLRNIGIVGADGSALAWLTSSPVAMSFFSTWWLTALKGI